MDLYLMIQNPVFYRPGPSGYFAYSSVVIFGLDE